MGTIRLARILAVLLSLLPFFAPPALAEGQEYAGDMSALKTAGDKLAKTKASATCRQNDQVCNTSCSRDVQALNARYSQYGKNIAQLAKDSNAAEGISNVALMGQAQSAESAANALDAADASVGAQASFAQSSLMVPLAKMSEQADACQQDSLRVMRGSCSTAATNNIASVQKYCVQIGEAAKRIQAGKRDAASVLALQSLTSQGNVQGLQSIGLDAVPQGGRAPSSYGPVDDQTLANTTVQSDPNGISELGDAPASTSDAINPYVSTGGLNLGIVGGKKAGTYVPGETQERSVPKTLGAQIKRTF